MRLSRRYSDKCLDASVPKPDSSGTPFHLAAANGHTNVVGIFLHGAHAHGADRHGAMPEMLVLGNGKERMAEVLKVWLANEDRDLREHEVDVGKLSGTEKKTTFLRGS